MSVRISENDSEKIDHEHIAKKEIVKTPEIDLEIEIFHHLMLKEQT